METRKFAAQLARNLLGRVAFEARDAARLRSPDSVHDLRVSIRRFSQCLRVFRDSFPTGAAKEVRRELRRMMRLASEVRNRDVAIEILKKAGEIADPPLAAALSDERKLAHRTLVKSLEQWNERNRIAKWRSGLNL
jgi:CHAD domain-containing protein